MFAIIAWGLSIALASLGTMILVLVIMRMTKHIVGFTYIGFGALRYDQFVTTNKRSIALTAVFIVAIYLLMFASCVVSVLYHREERRLRTSASGVRQQADLPRVLSVS